MVRPTDRPQIITYAISTMIVCLMCPTMSLIATLLFKEHTYIYLGTDLGHEHAHGADLAAAVCRPLTRLIFRNLFRSQLTAAAAEHADH